MKSNICSGSALEGQIAAVRGFSRFYTRKLGIIEPKLLDSPWTLQEARIIYEIAERRHCTATELVHALGISEAWARRNCGVSTVAMRMAVAANFMRYRSSRCSAAVL